MSKIEKCSFCNQPAIYLCACFPNTFLCPNHLQTHFTSSFGEHFLEPLRFFILPDDIQVLQSIQNSLQSSLKKQFEEKSRIR